MFKKLKKIEKIVFDICSVILVLFYSYSAVLRPVSTQYHRGIYVLITYVFVFMLYKSKFSLMRFVDYVLIFLSILSISYWIINFELINYRTGAETMLDAAMAIVGVLLSIEIARRVVGKVFVFMAIFLLFYGVYGEYMPDLISHAGETFPELCVSIFYKSDGIFGIMVNVLVNYVFLFVIFGAFLEKCGAEKFFIDWPLAAVGYRVGGPGKVAVIASCFFGTISGSAIANTASTGAFTIPMMKKAGFKPHIAGGIEPAASVGGMFMPPIMGAGGFIMAELTGVSYNKIMLVAIFPALMYFWSVYLMVHFYAKRNNIVGKKSEHSAMYIFKKEWFYIIPLIFVTVCMLIGYSPAYSVVLGIIACMITSWVREETRIGLKGFLEASRKGVENSLKIGATIGVIGIMIGVLTYSGLMLSFADIVIKIADGRLFVTILLIAFSSLILGVGLPVTVAYLITAVVAVPALTHLGVHELAAHMIIYWLSQDSNITPPVCIAAFVGATIAKACMWKTAFASFRFAKFLYLGAFLFGYIPGFSLNGSYMDIGKTFVFVIIGTYAYTWILSGIWIKYFKKMGWQKPLG